MAPLRSMAVLFVTLAGAPVAAHDAAPLAGHPEPRVIVTVTDLQGAHDAEEVQRAARETWGGLVRCYKQLGRREAGKLTVRLEITAAGKVVGTKRLGSTLNDAVAGCVTGVLRDRTMPGARSGSTATIELQLAPGDA